MEVLTKENIISKRYYTIGEVAQLLNVNASLIRFWESEFEYLKFRKNKKGDRLFTLDDINDLKMIYYLVKQQGYTLEGAKEIIKQKSNHLKNKIQALESLKKVRDFLCVLKAELPS